MSLEEEVVALRAEVRALREALAQAQGRIAELERRKTPAPAFVRANAPTDRPATPRRKRAPEHNAGRRREEPTQIVYHAEERCPDCGYLLRGQSVARSRQVIDLPALASVEITEHRLRKRHCPACDRWWTPRVDFSSQVLGHGRVGVRLVSLIAYLRQSARLPLATIQHVLATVHGVRLSVG